MFDSGILIEPEQILGHMDFAGYWAMPEELKATEVADVGDHFTDNVGEIHLVGKDLYFVPIDSSFDEDTGEDFFLYATIRLKNKLTDFKEKAWGKVPTERLDPDLPAIVSPEVRKAILEKARERRPSTRDTDEFRVYEEAPPVRPSFFKMLMRRMPQLQCRYH